MADHEFMPLRIQEVAPSDVLTDAVRFRRSMEIDTVGILLSSHTGQILQANHAFLQMSGYTRDDIRQGKLEWLTITPPEWHAISARAMQQFHETGSVIPYEKQYFRKDGSRFWALVASKLLSEEEGITFVLDITERKQAEVRLHAVQQELERSDSQLQTITDAIPTLIAYVDPRLRYIRVNRRYAHFFGTQPEDLIGKPMQQVLGGAFTQIHAYLKAALSGEPQALELTLTDTAGQPRYLSSQYLPDLTTEGHVLGIVIQSTDVTERRQAEHALRTTEKLAAVGRLAASMAHEINNPLEAVTNLLYLARHSDDAEATRGYLEQAQNELGRVASITNQTLRFHKQSTRPIAVRAEELFTGVLTVFTARLLNGSVEVRKRLRASEPLVCFDGEIRQVIGNLVSNALDAMVGRPAALFLRARHGTHLHTGQRGVRLTVADTGSGMSLGTLLRLWEPFFTTKEVGGTGLGLWISRDIIKRHKGEVQVRSRLGTGSLFSFWLPLDPPPA